MKVDPRIERKARIIYIVESKGHDAQGKARVWPRWDSISEKERDYWRGRAEIALIEQNMSKDEDYGAEKRE